MSLGQSLMTLILILTFVFFQHGKPALSQIEKQIIIEKYQIEFEEHKVKIYEHSKRKAKTDEINSVIDKIIDNIEFDENINDAKESVLQYSEKLISQNKNDANCNSQIAENYEKFKNNKLSFIESLKYAEQTILCAYWNNWSCNYDAADPKVYFTTDSLYLIENMTYQIPIRVEYDESNVAYLLLTNTLQKGDPNFINFKLPSANKKPYVYKYEIVAANNITGEFIHLRDSITVYSIKATTENMP